MATRRRARPIDAGLGVADEGAHQHESADQLRAFGCGVDGCAGSHRVPHHHGRAAELLDQGRDVAGGLDVAVGGKGRVAVAVTTQVGAGDAIPSGAQNRCEEAVGAAKVTHPGDQHHQRAIPIELVADPTVGAVEVGDGLCW